MYGIGDDPNPLQESVELLDDLVTEYIVDMCHEIVIYAKFILHKIFSAYAVRCPEYMYYYLMESV